MRNVNAKNQISNKLLLDCIKPAGSIDLLSPKASAPFYEYAVYPFSAKMPSATDGFIGFRIMPST